MSADDYGPSTARVGLIAAAVIATVATVGDAFANSLDACLKTAISQPASTAARPGGISLLGAARQLASEGTQRWTDAGQARAAADHGAPLTDAELQERIARYHVSPPQQGLPKSLASATVAASLVCRRDG